MLEDVIDPEEKDQRKMDAIAVWQLGVASIEPDLEEEIRVVEEFENRLKICCIYHYGRQSAEDTNNNSSKRKDAFDVLMNKIWPSFLVKSQRKLGVNLQVSLLD